MDIEDLSKAQLILLALLVSFVTSIATGIVTVSLMDKAPAGVTQTVHKVVERTVERVAPENQNASVGGGEQNVKEVTTVVKENDLITETINKNTKNLARIYSGTGTSTQALGSFVGLGVLVSGGEFVATDRALVSSENTYSAQLNDGTIVELTHAMPAGATKLALLALPEEHADSGATLAKPDSLKLGQTAIALSGRERNSVATGIIAELPTETVETEESETTRIIAIGTNIAANDVLVGAPLVNIFNETIGIAVTSGLEGRSARFLTSDAIATALRAYRKQQEQSEEQTGSTTPVEAE